MASLRQRLKFEAFLEPTPDWRLKVDAWHACKNAGLPLPPELTRLFGDKEPTVEVDITGILGGLLPGCGPNRERCLLINLSALPKNVHTLRVTLVDVEDDPAYWSAE